MKKKTAYLVSAILAVLLIAAMTVSAIASDGSITITIHPIKVLVNGEVFRPTDVNGKKVMTFTIDGTTYAPVRALAEAYGLEVGYDAAQNIATVNGQAGAAAAKADTARPADFTNQWTVAEKPVTRNGSEKVFTAVYSGDFGMKDFKEWWKSLSAAEIEKGAEALAAEAQELSPGYSVTMYFSYGTYSLGTAYAFGDFEQSNFTAASVWIK